MPKRGCVGLGNPERDLHAAGVSVAEIEAGARRLLTQAGASARRGPRLDHLSRVCGTATGVWRASTMRWRAQRREVLLNMASRHSVAFSFATA